VLIHLASEAIIQTIKKQIYAPQYTSYSGGKYIFFSNIEKFNNQYKKAESFYFLFYLALNI
jgi:hypothetical protein